MFRSLRCSQPCMCECLRRTSKVAGRHTCKCRKACVRLSPCSQLCAAEPEASNDETDWKLQHLPRPQGPEPRARVHRPRPVSVCAPRIPSIRRFDLLLGINHNCHSSVTPPPSSLFSHHSVVYIIGVCHYLHMLSLHIFPLLFPIHSSLYSVQLPKCRG